MKTRLWLIALGVCLCSLSGHAAKKKTNAKKDAPVEKVDTASNDTFSYALGLANTNGLKQYLVQRMGIDTAYVADFLKGFDEATLTEADMHEKARLAGKEIRAQVEEQVLPNANKQINDSVDILNKAFFIKGFCEGIAGSSAVLTMDSAQALVKKQMTYYHKAAMERKYGANRLAGEEFLKQNAKKDGVKTTASGLQYKVLTKGEGAVPQKTDKVTVHYEGHLIDGTEFDSSYKRNKPTTFQVDQVIPGWIEALTLMPVGSKWEIYVPQELAYGDREQSKIPPFSCLIFTVELMEIAKAQ